MICLKIGDLSRNVRELFRETLLKYSYEDKEKHIFFLYNKEDGILSLHEKNKKVIEVKVKIYTFLVDEVLDKMYSTSYDSSKITTYLEYGLEDEVKEYRASLIKKLLE
jgi:hypothetical protein